MRGFFGPEGTFTHQALIALLTTRSEDTQICPYATVQRALDAVRIGEVKSAVVPIENSVEGGVSATLDYLALPASPLRIMAEVVIPVSFDLLVRPGTSIDQIHSVISHPHAIAQVRGWLSDHLPHVSIVEKGSTAAGAAEVAKNSTYDAAIAAPIAAELYGLVPLARQINDSAVAQTRFVEVTNSDSVVEPTGCDKTTFVAYLRQDRSGALLDILSQLAVHGVNLCRIESRPTKTTLGHYCFSIDAEGHIADARLAQSLIGLKRICKDVVFLGSYPRADGIAPSIPDGYTNSDYESARQWCDQISVFKRLS